MVVKFNILSIRPLDVKKGTFYGRICPDCLGTGYDFGDCGQCDRCDGTGEI